MSGFIAVFNIDGEPVEPTVLGALMRRVYYRGPDKQDSWIEGNVGLGQTLLCISPEEYKHPVPPLTIDKVTIVGDVRLDSRSELIHLLIAAGQPAADDMTDLELVLRSYLSWSEALPSHVFGQFACAIWDARLGRMLAFRDHFGQQSVYYARVKNTLIISNELTALRLHPAVSSKLDDQAIGDFLMFGSIVVIEKTFTAFTDIRRLSGGHVLSIDRAGQMSIQRRWTLPTDQPMLRYRREEEYTEHFRSLLRMAVKDRMRADKIVVLMSGGLDSTSIAVTARNLIREGEVNAQLTAVTTAYERVHADDELYYAELAAKKIGVPLHVFNGDNYPLVDPLPALSEPTETYEAGFYDDVSRLVWNKGRISLYGEAADALFRHEQLFDVLRRFPVTQAFSIYRWLWQYLGKRPKLDGLGPALNPRNWRQDKFYRSFGFPQWISPDFASAAKLRERWEFGWQMRTPSEHKLHAFAYSSLTAPDWSTETEYLTAPKDYFPAFVVMPFLDLRLVNFMLALPPEPWFRKKYLERRAMQNDLPEEVLQRAKKPLGTILSSLLKQPSAAWVSSWAAVPELDAYLRREDVPSPYGDVLPSESYVNMRPLLLNSWLKQMKNSAILEMK
jgi:asparagine synthase (glutamine-hydrolysing)